mmetsp:Transcript_48290/g.134232  ORF Transcript_48290/g.134232 Transcript_48290/m.134232 type:complete len:287 (+) Transcript_48290:186-1046(+)
MQPHQGADPVGAHVADHLQRAERREEVRRASDARARPPSRDGGAPNERRARGRGQQRRQQRREAVAPAEARGEEAREESAEGAAGLGPEEQGRGLQVGAGEARAAQVDGTPLLRALLREVAQHVAHHQCHKRWALEHGCCRAAASTHHGQNGMLLGGLPIGDAGIATAADAVAALATPRRGPGTTQATPAVAAPCAQEPPNYSSHGGSKGTGPEESTAPRQAKPGRQHHSIRRQHLANVACHGERSPILCAICGGQFRHHDPCQERPTESLQRALHSPEHREAAQI